MIRVNFLPYRGYRKAAALKKLYVAIIFGLVISGAISFAGITLTERYFSETIEVANVINEQIKMQETTFKKIKEVKKDIKFYENKLKDFESLVSRRYETIKLLRELVEIIPDQAFIKKFNVMNKDITIEGYASNNNVVSILIEKINLSKVIKFIALKKINSIQVGGKVFQSFDISAISLL